MIYTNDASLSLKIRLLFSQFALVMKTSLFFVVFLLLMAEGSSYKSFGTLKTSTEKPEIAAHTPVIITTTMSSLKRKTFPLGLPRTTQKAQIVTPKVPTNKTTDGFSTFNIVDLPRIQCPDGFERVGSKCLETFE